MLNWLFLIFKFLLLFNVLCIKFSSYYVFFVWFYINLYWLKLFCLFLRLFYLLSIFVSLLFLLFFVITVLSDIVVICVCAEALDCNKILLELTFETLEWQYELFIDCLSYWDWFWL